MTTIDLPPRVSGSTGELLAEALTSTPLGERGIVLQWTTELDAAEFLALCDHLMNESRYVELLEVIADHEFIEFNADVVTNPGLRDEFTRQLAGRKLVRFNAPSWSVTWLERAGPAEPRQVQAFLGAVPSAMRTMISRSVSGVPSGSVEQFLDQLADVQL